MTGSERVLRKKRRVSARTTRAVSALLRCRTTAEAAEAADISESTLRRLRQQPEFLDAMANAQSEIFSSVCAEIRGLGGEAVATLASILKDANTLPAARTRAAAVILTLLLRVQRLDAQEQRLARLEMTLRRYENNSPRGARS
jgi:hypothetical protein